MSGLLIVSNLLLYVLIDLGATHSFIASRLYDKLEDNRQIFNTLFIIITLTRDMYQSTTWYKDVSVYNKIVIDMTDYDVILSMD